MLIKRQEVGAGLKHRLRGANAHPAIWKIRRSTKQGNQHGAVSIFRFGQLPQLREQAHPQAPEIDWEKIQ